MPAWITSELRELVCVPIASSASRITTSRPAIASSRATARPTIPAPITTASTRSTGQPPFEYERPDAGERGDARHGARRAVEERAEQGAKERRDDEADRADQRRSGARGLRERRKRGRGGAGEDERGAEKEERERRDERKPVLRARPGERGGRHAADDDDHCPAAHEARRSEA